MLIVSGTSSTRLRASSSGSMQSMAPRVGIDYAQDCVLSGPHLVTALNMRSLVSGGHEPFFMKPSDLQFIITIKSLLVGARTMG